jgi:hypothetical protein
MTPTEFWRWTVPDPRRKSGRRTLGWSMTAAEAADYPGAERVPGTMEVRQLPDSSAEFEHTSDGFRAWA